MINQCTKFEESRFTRYETMNGNAKKNRKWAGLGWLGALNVMGNAIIRQSAYDFLFDFNRNFLSIFYRFRDIACYLWKVANFDTPHLHLVPPQGVTRSNFAEIFGIRKPESLGYRVVLFSRFSRTPTCDRQTDTDTDKAHGYYRARIASRGKQEAELSPRDRAMRRVN